jgi:hypothetical protein
VSLVFLALPIFDFYSPVSAGQTIQYTSSKIVVLSVLSFGVVWSSRNFRAAKHNEVLSKHREDALGLFRAFVEATDDSRIKDAILLKHNGPNRLAIRMLIGSSVTPSDLAIRRLP